MNNVKQEIQWSPNKNASSTLWKGISFGAIILSIVALLLVISYMVINVDPAANTLDVMNDIIFGSDYNVAKREFGLAIPILMTFITTILSLIIAVPVSIKTAIFIVFRLRNRTIKRFLQGLVDLLAGIPSIVFGVFSLLTFGSFLRDIFGLDSSRNLLTATLTLSFMIIPMITSLTVNSLKAEKRKHWNSAKALGVSDTRIIYKIIKPAARKGIIVGVIVAMTRALGESMALSIILQGTASNFNSAGIGGFFNNSTPTLASLTARDFLGGDLPAGEQPIIRGAFFAGGIAFFVIIFILNVGILGITRNYKWKDKLGIKFKESFSKTRTNVVGKDRLLKLEARKGIETYYPTSFINDKIKRNLSFDDQVSAYLNTTTKRDQKEKGYSIYKLGWELLSVTLVLFFVSWILVDTLIIKASIVFSQPGYAFLGANSVPSGNSIGAAMSSTLILIVIVILISLPVSLLAAIYINEYAKKQSKILIVARFFIDALGSTPSIFFGIFGYVFFIQTLGINNSENGASIMAGSLTMLIVILPTFIRTLESALINVPDSYRYASLALGTSKWRTISKIVIPSALVGMSTSVILTIGRIVSETAPIYLTMGLSPNRPWSGGASETLLNNGQTLTTRIFENITLASSSDDYVIAYEAAFFCVLLIVFLNGASYMISNHYSKKLGIK